MPKSRYAARQDANHQEVVAALRKMGASVADTSRLGDGFPDLVVGWRGINVLFEVKDGAKRPSEIKLTPKETAFADKWNGQYCVVYSAEDAQDYLRIIAMQLGRLKLKVNENA